MTESTNYLCPNCGAEPPVDWYGENNEYPIRKDVMNCWEWVEWTEVHQCQPRMWNNFLF